MLLITLFDYFRICGIIRQHQQQIQSSQNFGQPAINLVKYKRSAKSILYVALFSLTLFPVLVLNVLVLTGKIHPCLEVQAMSFVSMAVCLLSFSLNLALYIWRMNDVRSGVK